MTFSDNNQPGDSWMRSPAANPDNGTHLDKIREEVTNAPYEQPKFYGLDIGIVKLGFTSDGAFNPGVDLGIVHAQAKVGLVNGADAGVDLGPIGNAGAGVYAGVDRNGFKGNVGAGGDVLGLVGADGQVNSRFGNATGVEAEAGANVIGVRGRAGGGAALGQDGFDAAAGGGAHAWRVAGVHGGAHVGLNRDSQVGAAVGGNLGDVGTSVGAGVWTDGNSTVRPDVYARGRAGYDHGTVDINPPGYYHSRPAYAPYGAADSQAAYPAPPGAQEIPYAAHGLGRPAPIESQPLPPVREAATPENRARFEQETRTELAHQYSYTVHKGDTYQSIAAKLMPGADATQLAQEAAKLKEMHENNGYHSLHAGQKLATLDPYAIDRQVRQAEAQHFGLANPQG